VARLYANASITAADGWRLTTWLLAQLHWLGMIGGNHDEWAQVPGMDPLSLLCSQHGVVAYAPDELRFRFEWKDRDDLEPINVWVRHDFPGRSWFHPLHGLVKAALLDAEAHLLVAGHLHSWGHYKTEQRNRITDVLRVRGFKFADGYARKLGFPEQQDGAVALAIIDPEATGAGRVLVEWDLEAGLRRLAKLRER